MEVLEHVDDAGAVVAEAARVLRPGGIFIFSGPNRTILNGVGLVLVAQDLLGLVPRGTHRWSRLLRPSDMGRHMRESGIAPGQIVGVGVRARSLARVTGAVMGLLLRRLTYPAAARRVELVAGTSKVMAYQGFGIRRQQRPPPTSLSGMSNHDRCWTRRADRRGART
jgi:2-polyprenyl-6-hydroxyphenyl methylase/3-demethylubiquinone-9 3-methyltransferase